MQKKRKWRRLPGFRSGTRWKLVTASLVYTLVLIGIITAVFSGGPSNNTGENLSEEDASTETEAADEVTALKNCSDFEDDQQLYDYWTENEFSSENDPSSLDANNDGVPCAVLSEGMSHEFTAYEKEQTGEASEADIPSYTLHKGKNTTYDNGVYLNYYVIPDVEPTSIDETDIDTISDEVIMNVKDKEEFNLLTISFVDAEEAMEYGGYIYGKTDYFPHGEINAAEDYETGDYSDHEISTVYGSINNAGLPKQEENYPTEKQLEMYFYWAGPAYEQSSDSENSPVETTADKFDVPKEKVEQAIQKASHR
ncbi:hypothetical protein SAMN05421781_0530 [Marinococcus luteus]|uniref:Excalibur calcium-binding domain-containing protein n=1 Tax=Marinococcus luteus TaxID=1122204 RepID=A0A1H2QZM5_9BACI|nr:hypothetical protein [Marinococcus luteus]SDW12545.1 hypothetical protein SAMN05421781_0530 [Marinococcus luteus]